MQGWTGGSNNRAAAATTARAYGAGFGRQSKGRSGRSAPGRVLLRGAAVGPANSAPSTVAERPATVRGGRASVRGRGEKTEGPARRHKKRSQAKGNGRGAPVSDKHKAVDPVEDGATASWWMNGRRKRSNQPTTCESVSLPHCVWGNKAARYSVRRYSVLRANSRRAGVCTSVTCISVGGIRCNDLLATTEYIYT